MQKIILSLCLLLTLSAATSAQGFHVGAKLGANLGKIDGESFNQGYNLGYLAGAYVNLGFSKSIGIQPEVLFSQTNTKIDSGYKVYNPDAIIGSKAHLNYLNIPILLNINASKLLTLQIGPQFSILMNKDESLVANGKDAIQSGDLAAVLGAQLNLGLLNVYGRYNIGLANLNDINKEEKWKSQTIQLGVGIKIF
jgi:Outer membrane protein beta-barrel domain